MKLFSRSTILSLCFVSIFNFALLTFNLSSAVAQTMSNSNFKLKTNILLKPNKDVNKELNVQANVVVGPNFKVVSGFQHNPFSSTKPFIFSISQTLIDYGALSPANPVSRTNTLTIYNNFANGYTVTTSENHHLINPISQSTMPDTTCDTGTCSEQNSAPWKNILTYGFGYRCDNASDVTACSDDFYESNYYKQLPNISNSEKPQIVMSGANIGESKARITYKVNIPVAQPSDFYSNTITFIATPNF